MTDFRLAFCALAAFTYLTFMWGVWGVFARRGTPSAGLRVLQIAALLSAVAEVAAIAAADDIRSVNAVAGVILYASSLALFAASARMHRRRALSLAYSPDEPEHLVRAGPYRWVRHPFYSSYLVSYVAGLVLSGDQRLWIVVVAMAAIYVHAARVEEGKFEHSPLRTEYRRYKNETGMLLPNVIKWMRSTSAERRVARSGQ